ncbi:MAG: hypothetical protein R3323_10850 [Wenzhouxiangellaceae bacterium]|nr:hypothetical protein [Wenzhouxiangellaceae bacterium]
MSEVADTLQAQVDASLDWLERVEEGNGAYPRLPELQHWQRARLRETYDDLRREDACRDACTFFLQELYGGRDMRERDRQLKRVVPVMRRFLPERLLHAVGEAMRLQWMSLALDAELSTHLDGPLDQPEYARAYRRHAAWDRREEQIRLIDELGRLLIEVVERPMIRRLVRWMQGPAVSAGFGRLQSFLMQGLDAFAKMGGDADRFVDTIVKREREALEAMRNGDDFPFRPWIGEGPRLPEVEDA